MLTDSAAIRASVVAAFLDFGLLNAGTPLEMASTPVSAADPEEKLRANRKISGRPVSACSASMWKEALCAGTSAPKMNWTRPVSIIAAIEKMNAYTGIANAEPGLPDAAQVGRADQHDDAQGEQDRVLADDRDRRPDVGHAGRGGHRDRQDVVDQQGTGHDQAGGRSQVLVTTS